MRGFPLAIVAFGILAPIASAHGFEDVVLEIEAREDFCPGGLERCLVVRSGNLTDLKPCDLECETVGVLYRNLMFETDQQLFAAPSQFTDPKNLNSAETSAIAATPLLPPGQADWLDFTMPLEVDGIYFWDGTPGSEAAGMWILVPFVEPDTGGSPGPGVLLLLVAAGVGLRLAVKRSDRPTTRLD